MTNVEKNMERIRAELKGAAELNEFILGLVDQNKASVMRILLAAKLLPKALKEFMPADEWATVDSVSTKIVDDCEIIQLPADEEVN